MQIRIATSDLSKPQRERLAAAMRSPAQIGRAMAESALPLYQRQMATNARSNRNRFGARSTFWNRMNSGTRGGVTPAGGVVMMPREMRLRVNGGTVRPVNAKNLTIPLRAEAYGKSLRQFERVFFFRKGGRLFGATRSLQVPRSRRGGTAQNRDGSRRLVQSDDAQRITVLFLLVKSATIRGNRGLLPSDDVVSSAVIRGVTRFVRARQ